MDLRLILADEPGAWITFTHRDRQLKARLDPMWLGAERVPELLDTPLLVRGLLDVHSQVVVMTSDPFARHIDELFEDYLEATGLGVRGIAELIFALRNVDLVELDLLREGLEIREWLDPAGSLSSRRLLLLLQDWMLRPETRIGARRMNINPASKAALVTAQSVSSPDDPHPFLKSPAQLAVEEKQLAEQQEKRRRIERQRPRELEYVPRTAGSLADAQAESKQALEELKAQLGQ